MLVCPVRSHASKERVAQHPQRLRPRIRIAPDNALASREPDPSTLYSHLNLMLIYCARTLCGVFFAGRRATHGEDAGDGDDDVFRDGARPLGQQPDDDGGGRGAMSDALASARGRARVCWRAVPYGAMAMTM